MLLENQYLSDLDPEKISAIVASINRERLSPYLLATKSDVEALALYELNARLSNCLHETVGGFEVTLRNAVSEAIKGHFKKNHWYRDPAFTSLLAPERQQNLQDALLRLKKHPKAEGSGQVVAGLTFNFWVSMHEYKYRDVIWTPFLRKIWPDGSDNKQIHRDLSKIRILRNRIAHYEPVFAKHWYSGSDIIWTRLNELSPEKCAWLEARVKPKLDPILADLEQIRELA